MKEVLHALNFTWDSVKLIAAESQTTKELHEYKNLAINF